MALIIGHMGRTAVGKWMAAATRRQKTLAGLCGFVLGTVISWVGVQVGAKEAIGVVMLCNISTPFLYAFRILMQEWVAGRKIRGALGTERGDATEGLSAGADSGNDPPPAGMLLGARSEDVVNPLADSGRLTYTTSRGTDDIVE